jgi:hypothetical protein
MKKEVPKIYRNVQNKIKFGILFYLHTLLIQIVKENIISLFKNEALN